MSETMKTASNTNESARFTIDFLNKEIIGTRASFNKASKGSGAAYEELTAKIAAHPEFKLVVKKQERKSKKPKQTYKGMDFDFMESYIAIQPNREALMNEYNSAKMLAKATGISIYPFTKKWFLETFAAEDHSFDMAEAKKAISDARMKEAVKNAQTKNGAAVTGEAA